jgi:hypothetical protein
MIKPKLWTYAAAGAALAIALSSAALGANAEQHGAGGTLPDEASRVASAVLGALTGGSNPSTVASSGRALAEHATDVDAKTNDTDDKARPNKHDQATDAADKAKDKAEDKADKAKDKADKAKDKADEAKDKADIDEADKDGADAKDVAEGQETKPASTTGTKPGRGCGDDKHEHSGPPGRPGASMPPGCAKAKSH